MKADMCVKKGEKHQKQGFWYVFEAFLGVIIDTFPPLPRRGITGAVALEIL